MTINNNPVEETASLANTVSRSVQKYFAELNGVEPFGLHQIVLEEIEIPLFRAVMEHCKYNQSKAAEIMGLSRGTLRAKLKQYFDDQYVGTR